MKLFKTAILATSLILAANAQAADVFEMTKVKMCSTKATFSTSMLISRYIGLSKADATKTIMSIDYPEASSIVDNVFNEQMFDDEIARNESLQLHYVDVYSACFLGEG